MLDSIADAMTVAGLEITTLNYTMHRWDLRWWALEATLNNGSQLGFNTTGYYPYSGNTGARGVTGKVHDAGTYGVDPNTQEAAFGTLNLTGLSAGTIAFLDNPTVTRNYSLPGYDVFGTSRNISTSAIPELGNLTSPHWISAKTLNFTLMNQLNISAAILSWVDTSDENAALQWLPSRAPPGNATNTCPTLYVGNSTGEVIRGLIEGNQIANMTVVLDAPSEDAPTFTMLGRLEGSSGLNKSILLYTHSSEPFTDTCASLRQAGDGPSIIEENGPLMLLTLAEYFARNKPSITLDLVITTGHLSGGKLNESAWMGQRPDLMENAYASISIEHLGAIEWKDHQTSSGPIYSATGLMEPMWTNAYAKSQAPTKSERQLTGPAFPGMLPLKAPKFAKPTSLPLKALLSTCAWPSWIF
ncbi:uncharacterized protein PG998_002994 [Apiospora kogelbergensis]|uniref:uncharacterized protein n=1 Tax=Apiospora kogelbergensis TaxID=1337665 RepID=UPI003130F228